jgi:hypothetical protein
MKHKDDYGDDHHDDVLVDDDDHFQEENDAFEESCLQIVTDCDAGVAEEF